MYPYIHRHVPQGLHANVIKVYKEIANESCNPWDNFYVHSSVPELNLTRFLDGVIFSFYEGWEEGRALNIFSN